MIQIPGVANYNANPFWDGTAEEPIGYDGQGAPLYAYQLHRAPLTEKRRTPIQRFWYVVGYGVGVLTSLAVAGGAAWGLTWVIARLIKHSPIS